VVSISAERREEKDVKEGERVLRSERYVGKVSRSFQLAQEIDEAQVTAKYADGVLELACRRKPPAQARKITIQ
jgi:HSP20 family protein